MAHCTGGAVFGLKSKTSIHEPPYGVALRARSKARPKEMATYNDEMPDLEDAQEICEDVDWDESGDEEMIEQVPVQCLFCTNTLPDPPQVFTHCREQHKFDVFKFNQIHQLDCFGYIKFVNYIRKERPAVETLMKFNSSATPWNDDSFMKPVLENDPLLQYDLEDLLELGERECGTPADDDGATMDLPVVKYREMLDHIRQMEARAVQAEEGLQQAMADLGKMKLAASNLVMSAPSAPASHSAAIEKLQEGDDNAYIDSYSHFGIHQEMLQDKVRTESYRDSMYKNKESLKDKVVLDVGCGTGILSMFAARAGARRVIGVDMSDVIYQAMDIVRENGLEDKITLIKGRMEDVDLPVDEVDIIISEWMGYCLLFESMLDSVLWARDNYLVEGGLVLPDHCDMRLVAIADQQLHQNNVKYWEDVYGFKMTCMRESVIKEASITVVDQSKIITNTCVFKELDVCKAKVKDLEFTCPVQLEVTSAGDITAFVVYFDINFRLSNIVTFSTGPQTTPTHWKQTVLVLEEPLSVEKGQVLKGQFILRKIPNDPRSCKVTLSMAGTTTTYTLS